MKRTLLLLSLVGVLAGCESPSDVIVDPPGYAPFEDRDGRFRVTTGAGPEVVRGFLPDGRLLFRTFDLVPFGEDWVLVSAPLDGGLVREELAVYRPALVDDMSHLVHDGVRRVLVLWKAATPGLHGCPDSSITTAGTPGPAPRTPSPVGITLFALPEVDGTPVAAIPSRFVSTNVVEGAGTIQQRVRVHPTLRDVDRTGANAFGPVMLPGTDNLIFSDGQFLWRASIADTASAPVPIGEGAYPALSPDGGRLVYARPVGLDSIVTQWVVPVSPFAVCREDHVEISAAGWEIVIRELASGVETVVTEGRDPVFHPTGDRVVVRTSALAWLDLATSSLAPIPATSGAFSPVVSADGGILAFSIITAATGADVYFLRLDR